MNRTLFIHIGSHKTGTTSIQKTLYENSSLLEKNGYFCFHQNLLNPLENGAYGSVNKLFRKYSTHNHEGTKLYDNNVLINALSQIIFDGDVIISSEQFFFINDKLELSYLKEKLDKQFHTIKIISYLRRQDEQIISHRQQGVFNQYSNSSIFYGNEPRVIPTYQKHFDLYLNYNQKLSMWADVFGQENMIIRNYHELYQKDAVKDFFHLFNIENIQTVKLNVSSGFEKTKVGLLANSQNVRKYEHLGLIINKFCDEKGKMLPSKDEAIEFYNRYKQSNKELNLKFKLNDNEYFFNEDFSKYPEASGDLWDEQSANQAIGNIVNGLNQTYGSIDYNILYKAVMQLEHIDQELSYRLIETLKRIFPEQQFF